MSVAAKALWFIESRFRDELGLDDVAAHCGVSRWHLARLFPLATGHSVGAYIRARRLSEAAKLLAQGAPDILALALDHGYGSHEAFTRAFRQQFGLTPEELRARRTLPPNLQEALPMNTRTAARLAPPRMVPPRPMLFAGLGADLKMSDPGAIPAQWQKLVPWLGQIPNAVGKADFGVITSAFVERDTYHYLCGVEVSALGELPPEFEALRLPAQRYAAFRYEGHITGIRGTIHAVFADWLPQSGEQAAGLPDFIEYYGPGFDPQKGEGDVEIWLPLKG